MFNGTYYTSTSTTLRARYDQTIVFDSGKRNFRGNFSDDFEQSIDCYYKLNDQNIMVPVERFPFEEDFK